MEQTGKVCGFSNYTPQLMEKMKKDLGISMPLPQLLYCASYYRSYEQRDPLIAELKLLDAFIKEHTVSCTDFCPTELFTNDTFVAETYADLMKKRHTLYPNAKRPCAISEIPEIANAYLFRAGKSSMLPELCTLIEGQDRLSTGIGENDLPSADGAFRLKSLFGKKAKYENGDLLILIPSPKARRSEETAAHEEFWKKPEISPLIKQIMTVGDSGLLELLIKHFEALYIDASRLSKMGEPVPLTVLSGSYAGDRLIRVGQKDFHTLNNTAKAVGIRIFTIAAIANGTKFTLVHGNNALFSLESSFLRSLIPIKPITLKLADEKKCASAPIMHTPSTASTCAYLFDPACAVSEIVALQGHLYATASSHLTDSFFRNALDTLLQPIMTLAAAGCDFAVQRLALGLDIPQSDSNTAIASETLSTLLGIYRLQTELAMPAASLVMTPNHQAEHPKLTAFAIAQGGDPCPCEFISESNRVYCIAPDTQANGLPAFDSLRNLLNYVAQLRRKGVLKGATVLCRESVTDGIRKMSNGALFCRITNEALVSDGVLPLAFLLETTEDIPAKKVGIVTKKAACSASPTRYKLPDSKSLVWSEAPRITVVAKENDHAAQMLLSKLIKNGAAATLFSDKASESAPLSREILGTHTLILCGTVRLQETAFMRFALDTFTNAGGRVLLLGGAHWNGSAPAYAFTQGLPPEILDQICKK